jgi:peptidoglycan/LPS O-acetylase OafA/YrhL
MSDNEMPLEDRSSKITFANQLRGLAVVCVMIAHYTIVYWGPREFVAGYMHAPAAVGPAPRWAEYIAFPTLNYGPFGVALFFLISGFVIPFSLEKMGSLRFIAARMLRICPTYWLCSAITLSALWVSSQYWSTSYRLQQDVLVANSLLVHEHLDLPSIDLVNWTLVIEVRFYITAALMWPLIRRSSVLAIFNFSLAVLALLTWIPPSWSVIQLRGTLVSVESMKAELLFLPFLFIGTLFHFGLKGHISPRTLWSSVLGVFLIFSMMWKKSPLAAEFPLVTANYLYALVLFGGCYMARARFKESRILDFFADISYPLYLLHSLIGYAVIRFLMAHGWRFTPAMGGAFLLVVALAYLVHVVIEVPSVRLGRRIGRSRRAPARQREDLLTIK